MKRIASAVLAIALMMAVAAPTISGAAPAGGRSRVVYLGTAVYRGRLVTGYAFIHGRSGGVSRFAKPGKPSPLYTFLARGARWRSTEPYVVNGANADGVSAAAVSDAMAAAASTWEAQVAFNIFGSGSTTQGPLAADWVAPDGRNEAYFSKSELDQRTVAVTVVWGVFGGPVETRELIEWDMVFNDALPEHWGDATASSSVWDVTNIATHEIGHSAGLGDLYSSAAAAQTMYGYASYGETQKRTLESGDIAGIKALYR
jgi:hypothetical protein